MIAIPNPNCSSQQKWFSKITKRARTPSGGCQTRGNVNFVCSGMSNSVQYRICIKTISLDNSSVYTPISIAIRIAIFTSGYNTEIVH